MYRVTEKNWSHVTFKWIDLDTNHDHQFSILNLFPCLLCIVVIDRVWEGAAKCNLHLARGLFPAWLQTR
ncbi:hypothetical protein EUGRSUZ_E02705 [Eucalyptus grandis]|uniref:Uncharacterized protein n=2 Tax=Eucalyptus grandis TaxID=71139 RepID=A0ACC3KYU8_EUCGR|nr:hypothetical protein EUGRSUZ_E02705 [Eucalyptus grandis]